VARLDEQAPAIEGRAHLGASRYRIVPCASVGKSSSCEGNSAGLAIMRYRRHRPTIIRKRNLVVRAAACYRSMRSNTGLAEIREGFLGAHWLYGLSVTHQEHKKSADPHQAAESSVDIFCSEDRSPAHRPFEIKAPCRLQRQVAGSGFPDHS